MVEYRVWGAGVASSTLASLTKLMLCVGMMTWKPPTDSFTVERPLTDVFAPSGGWNDKIDAKAPWQVSPPPKPSYQNDENLKKLFGIELAKSTNAFEAACKLAGEDTSKALWISFNWIADPIVIASKDVYVKTLEISSPPLDRDQLAAKVLALSDEKILNARGQLVPTIEAKDRIAALKLYSEILGFTGKVEIDNSTKTITHNEMTIKLVKAEDKKPVTIEHTPNIKSEMFNDKSSPITLKLVGGSR